MKKEIISESPLMLLPTSTEETLNFCSRHWVPEFDSAGEKIPQRCAPKYDVFNGILKKVSDMKLSGSLNFEEPGTESEKSERSITKGCKPCSFDRPSKGSALEFGSSGGSFVESELCLPCEEIPRARLRRSHPRSPSTGSRSVSEIDFDISRYNYPPSSFSIDAKCAKNKMKNSESSQAQRSPSSTMFFRDEKKPLKNGNHHIFSTDLNDNRTGSEDRQLKPKEWGHPEGIADSERHQIEMFFRSLKTQVFVCGSLANLYFGWKGSEGDWSYRHTGIVVVILDRGDTRSKRKRRIQILLAEKGTCFPLWKDTIDNLSDYHKSGTAFHTMHVSSDHRQIAGFSFDCSSEAEKLVKHIEELTSDPENINISVPGSKKKVSRKKKSSPLPHKKQISNPCLFQHVTSIVAKDKETYLSLQTLVVDDVGKNKENSDC